MASGSILWQCLDQDSRGILCMGRASPARFAGRFRIRIRLPDVSRGTQTVRSGRCCSSSCCSHDRLFTIDTDHCSRSKDRSATDTSGPAYLTNCPEREITGRIVVLAPPAHGCGLGDKCPQPGEVVPSQGGMGSSLLEHPIMMDQGLSR